MTNTTARLLPVNPGRVRAALLNALSRHGVEPKTAESIWYDLTTGQDPRPADVPETVIYRGISVDWPRGRHLRVLHISEVKQINRALCAAGKAVRASELLDNEDNAEAGRHAVEWLHTHKSHPSYNPEPVRAEELRLLVAEATEVRRAENEPILVPEPLYVPPTITDQPEAESVSEPEPEGVPDMAHEFSDGIENPLCWHVSPRGRTIRCTADRYHAGKHTDGKHTWIERKAKATKIEHVTTPERVVTAQPVAPVAQSITSEIDDLLASIAAIEAKLA